jgi:DNA primase
MKWTNEQIRAVRELSIAQQIGLAGGRRTKINCPHPEHRDTNASFLLDEKNCYYCFGCGVSGCGFIDFCILVGYSFEDIMNEYLQR